jgi:hypothetical protein
LRCGVACERFFRSSPRRSWRAVPRTSPSPCRSRPPAQPTPSAEPASSAGSQMMDAASRRTVLRARCVPRSATGRSANLGAPMRASWMLECRTLASIAVRASNLPASRTSTAAAVRRVCRRRTAAARPRPVERVIQRRARPSARPTVAGRSAARGRRPTQARTCVRTSSRRVDPTRSAGQGVRVCAIRVSATRRRVGATPRRAASSAPMTVVAACAACLRAMPGLPMQACVLASDRRARTTRSACAENNACARPACASPAPVRAGPTASCARPTATAVCARRATRVSSMPVRPMVGSASSSFRRAATTRCVAREIAACATRPSARRRRAGVILRRAPCSARPTATEAPADPRPPMAEARAWASSRRAAPTRCVDRAGCAAGIRRSVCRPRVDVIQRRARSSARRTVAAVSARR